MTYEGYKIKYGYVSQRIKDMDPEERDILLRNTELCIGLSDVLKFNDIFMQVLNHIILEVPRATELDLVREQTERYRQQNRDSRQMQREFHRKIEDFEKDFDKIQNEYKSFENRISSIQGEFIGILSIFAAMFITFFGGVQMLGSIMTAIENTNFYVLSMITILVGIIMFNIIYMLLYTIGKIINRNIGINMNNKNCSGCTKKSLLSCLLSKYPLPFFYNLFSVIVFIIIFIFNILDTYGVIEHLTTSLIWLVAHGKYLNIIFIFAILLLGIVFMVNLLIISINKIHKSKTCSNISNNINKSNLDENLETIPNT